LDDEEDPLPEPALTKSVNAFSSDLEKEPLPPLLANGFLIDAPVLLSVILPPLPTVKLAN